MVTKEKDGVEEWTTRSPVHEQDIPEYFAEDDSHCTYTKSTAFKSSPYYRYGLGRYEISKKQVGGLAPIVKMDPSSLRDIPDGHLPKFKGKKRLGEYLTTADFKNLSIPHHSSREGQVEKLQGKLKRIKKRARSLANDPPLLDSMIRTSVSSLIPQLNKLRCMSVEVVEALNIWRNEVKNAGRNDNAVILPQLTWSGCNYLLKMTLDVDFIGHTVFEGSGLLLQDVLGIPLVRNPLFASTNLDDMVKNHHSPLFPILGQTDSNYVGATCEKGTHIDDDRMLNAAKTLLNEETLFGRVSPISEGSINLSTFIPIFDNRSRNNNKNHGPKKRPKLTGLPYELSASDDLNHTYGQIRPIEGSPIEQERKNNYENSHGHYSVSPQAGLLQTPTWSNQTKKRKFLKEGGRGKHLPHGRLEPLARPYGVGFLIDAGFVQIKPHDIVEFYHSEPSALAHGVLRSLYFLLIHDMEEPVQNVTQVALSWKNLAFLLLHEPLKLLQRLAAFDPIKRITVKIAEYLQPIFTDSRFNPDFIRPHNRPAALLCSWCLIKASRYVLRPELCMNSDIEEMSEKRQVVHAIQSLREELREIKTQINVPGITNIYTHASSSNNMEPSDGFSFPSYLLPSTPQVEKESAVKLIDTEQLSVFQINDEDIVVSNKVENGWMGPYTKKLLAPQTSKIIGMKLSKMVSSMEDDIKKDAFGELADKFTLDENNHVNILEPEILFRKGVRISGKTLLMTISRWENPRGFILKVFDSGTSQIQRIVVTDFQLYSLLSFSKENTSNELNGLVDWLYFDCLCKYLIGRLEVDTNNSIKFNAKVKVDSSFTISKENSDLNRSEVILKITNVDVNENGKHILEGKLDDTKVECALRKSDIVSIFRNRPPTMGTLMKCIYMNEYDELKVDFNAKSPFKQDEKTDREEDVPANSNNEVLDPEERKEHVEILKSKAKEKEKQRKRKRKLKKKKKKEGADGPKDGSDADENENVEEIEETEEQKIARIEEERREELRHKGAFFEELDPLPGKVTVIPGQDFCKTSTDLRSTLKRGDLISIDGIRCVVSTNVEQAYDPIHLPLQEPFPRRIDGVVISQPEPPEEENKTENVDPEQPESIKPATPPKVLEEEKINIKAMKIRKIPVELTRINVLVSVEPGSKRMFTTKDLRYKLRPGDFLRLDRWATARLDPSTDGDVTFEPDELTLEEPFMNDAGIGLTKVVLEKMVAKPGSGDIPSYMKKRGKGTDKENPEEQEEETLSPSELKALQEENNEEKFFGYKMKWKHLGALLGEGQLNKKQEDYWSLVSMDFAIKEVYNMLCSQWYPASADLDGAKFVKFIKELPDMVSDELNPTQIDLVFAKSKEKGERKIDFDIFVNKALPMIAEIKYPWLSPEESIKKVLHEHIFKWKECEAIVWKEAKRLAMVDECKQQCAALKVQSRLRGLVVKKDYKRHLKAIKSMQNTYVCYKIRMSFLHKLLALREAEDKRRRDIKAKRAAREKARLFSEGRVISGTMNLVTIYKHMKGAIQMITYNPKNCDKFTFYIQQEELRHLLTQSTGISDLSLNEIYMGKYLSTIVDKLAYRKRNGKKVIVIGQSAVTERGIKLIVQAVYIQATDKSKVLHIVSVFEHRGNFSFHAYDPKNQRTKVVHLMQERLYQWFGWDRENETMPQVLRPENRKDLMKWFLEHMFICRACGMREHSAIHKQGEDVLMLEFQVIEQRENAMARRIQGMYKSKRALRLIRDMIKRLYKKHKDPQSGLWYYLNTISGELSWSKPYLLGSEEIPDPPDLWEQTKDEAGNVYYFHPLTGRTSWMSEHEAAEVVQKLYRKRQGDEFRIKDMAQIIKALKFQREAEENFKNGPERLSSIVNYALLVYTRDHNMKVARELYNKAIEMAPHNPLVLYSGGIFELAWCSYPRDVCFTKGMKMIDKARSIDKQYERFMTAFQAFFHWGVVIAPTNPRALLNYALVQQCVFQDYDKAEKFYRRAIDLDPQDKSILANYNDFLENRLPGGKFAGGGPGSTVQKRSIILRHEGEWKEMRDPEAAHEKYSMFWWNEFNQQTVWSEPDWTVVWMERRKRSEVVDERGEWTLYQDKYQGQLFYYNFGSGQTQWEEPEAWH